MGRGIDLRNWHRLVEDLQRGRSSFRSWPTEAHVQFSSFCNMSCIMCWDGDHPPVRDLEPEVARKVEDLADRGLRLLIPHDGSEPTARRWREAVDLARRSGLRMEVTTNAAALTPERLVAAADVIDHLTLSVDSHLPEVLATIRQGVRAEVILDHVRAAATTARALGIRCSANVVLLVQNLDTVHDTVRWLGRCGIDEVSVIRMVQVNGRAIRHDPFVHASPSDIALVRKRCAEAAEEVGASLWWTADGPDLRPRGRAPGTLHHDLHRRYDELRYAHPGYCRFVHSGLRISADGSASPCGYAGDDLIPYGNLGTATLDEVWNSPTAQDLRRAMRTRDLPTPCDTCQHAADPEPATHHDWFDGLVVRRWVGPAAQVVGGGAVHRSDDAPSIELAGLSRAYRRFDLVLAHPGQRRRRIRHVEATQTGSRAVLQVPDALWRDLRPNQGYWFTVLGASGPRRAAVLLDAAWCLVRTVPEARIHGSDLRYGSTAEPPAVFLGASIPVRRPTP